MTPFQLRLQERNWLCRIEKSRSYGLHEHSSPIILPYALLPQGKFAWVLEFPLLMMPTEAVYQIPTENDLPTESIALALQRIFYLLQTSDQPVGGLPSSSFRIYVTDAFPFQGRLS